MTHSVFGLSAFQRQQFRENELQQAGFFQQNKPNRRFGRKDDFVQFVGNTLFGNDFDPIFVAGNGIECSLFEKKPELRCKPDSPHHTKRVVRKCNVGIERSAYNEVFQIFQPVERVNKLTEPILIQAKRQCIDGEVAAVLVVFKCSVFHHRIARIVRVGLLAGAYKLHFPLAGFQLSSTVSLENRKLRFFTQLFSYSLGQFYSTANYHDVDILRWPMKKNIPHKSAYNVGFQPHFICRFRNQLEYFVL